MNDTVRVGMVGTSWYADWMHLPMLKSHPRASIQAICGKNQDRAAEMAGKYGIPQVFSDYREMIQQGNLDAVIIAVPDDLHYPMTMAALEQGLHVLCEKPMAFTLEQALQMLAKAEASGVTNMVFFTWRWVPYFRTLHHYINQGTIGRCYDAHFQYVGGYARDGYYQWRFDRQHGLGILGDLGSHMIDMARFLVGEIASVNASLDVRVVKPATEGVKYERANDSASLLVQFENGATGMIFTSAAVELGNRNSEQRVVLYGEDGTLVATADATGWSVRGMRTGEVDFQELPVPDEFLLGTSRDALLWDQLTGTFSTQSIGTRLFIDGILEGRGVSPSFYDGMKTQEVIQAAFQSDRSHMRVEIGKTA